MSFRGTKKVLKIGVFPEDIIDSHIAPTSGKARHDRDDAIEKRAHRSQKCTSRAFRASNAPLPVRDPTKNESFLFPEEEIFEEIFERNRARKSTRSARTAFTARGALFLNVTPWVALPKLMVYSLVTTSSAPIFMRGVDL